MKRSDITIASTDGADEILHAIHPQLVAEVAHSRAFLEDMLEQVEIAKAMLHEAVIAEREIKRLLDGDLYLKGEEADAEVAGYACRRDFAQGPLLTSPPAPQVNETEPPAAEENESEPTTDELLAQLVGVTEGREEADIAWNGPGELVADSLTIETATWPAAPDAYDPAQALLDERQPAADSRKVLAALPALWAESGEVTVQLIAVTTMIKNIRVHNALASLRREGKVRIETQKRPGHPARNLIFPPIEGGADHSISPDQLDRAREMLADHKTVSMIAMTLDVPKRQLYAALHPNAADAR